LEHADRGAGQISAENDSIGKNYQGKALPGRTTLARRSGEKSQVASTDTIPRHPEGGRKESDQTRRRRKEGKTKKKKDSKDGWRRFVEYSAIRTSWKEVRIRGSEGKRLSSRKEYSRGFKKKEIFFPSLGNEDSTNRRANKTDQRGENGG